MKTIAIAVVVLKFLLASPFILWGLFIGVIGLGPDGAVPLSVRIPGLCVFFGSLAAAYPFSLMKLQGWANWIIVAISALPLGLAVYLVWTWGWPDDFLNIYEAAGMAITGAICILFPIIAAIDFFLSRKLIAMDERKRTETVQ